jgi:hypothetical protein
MNDYELAKWLRIDRKTGQSRRINSAAWAAIAEPN